MQINHILLFQLKSNFIIRYYADKSHIAVSIKIKLHNSNYADKSYIAVSIKINLNYVDKSHIAVSYKFKLL